MSKNTREFFEQVKAGEQPGLVEKIKEHLSERLSPSTILGEVWAEVKQQAAHGAHELAAALFNQNAFVLYPRQPDHDDPQQGHGQEMQHDHDRGGREM
jgi:hypothetical protein